MNKINTPGMELNDLPGGVPIESSKRRNAGTKSEKIMNPDMMANMGRKRGDSDHMANASEYNAVNANKQRGF